MSLQEWVKREEADWLVQRWEMRRALIAIVGLSLGMWAVVWALIWLTVMAVNVWIAPWL